MPTARVRLRDPTNSCDSTGIPNVLKTPSGTVMLEIQGTINVGESPLIRTELDLGPEGPRREEAVRIGELDLSKVTEAGSPVSLLIGESQMLRGKIVKLRAPLALMEMSQKEQEVDVVEIITHKATFNSRPEPVLSS